MHGVTLMVGHVDSSSMRKYLETTALPRHRCRIVRACSLRLATVYGYGDGIGSTNPNRGVLNNIIQRAIKGQWPLSWRDKNTIGSPAISPIRSDAEGSPYRWAEGGAEQVPMTT
jgi:hypothetical protein